MSGIVWSVRVRDFERTTNGPVLYVIELQRLTEHSRNVIQRWSVNRRYSDFLRLRKALRSAYPLCIIPPIPGKTNLFNSVRQQFMSTSSQASGKSSLQLMDQLFSYQTDFSLVDYRCGSLQTFLQHTLIHSLLSRDPLLLKFLSSENDPKISPVSDNVNSSLSPDVPSNYSSTSSIVDGEVESTSTKTLNSRNTHLSNPSSNINSTLLKNRALALQTAFIHLAEMEQRMLKLSSHIHHLHKNHAESICQLSPLEKSRDVVADTLQTVGHELDSYSFIMDPAMEENAELSYRFDIWRNYGTSLIEVADAYGTEQNASEGGNQLGSITCQEPPGSRVLQEVLHLEGIHEKDLVSIFQTYALQHFRRADRCRRIWERMHSNLTRTLQTISTPLGKLN